MSSKQQTKQKKKIKSAKQRSKWDADHQQTSLCGLCRSRTVHVQYRYRHRYQQTPYYDVAAQVASHKTAIGHTWR